jgi:DoxX-like protein
MSTAVSPVPAPKRAKLWTGRVLSALPILLFVMTGCFSLTRSPQMVASMKQFGYAESSIVLIAVLEIGSALLYAIPQTNVLGAIVMTGYLGGAVATHVRVGDPGWPAAVVTGIVVWLGLYLRDERLRALVPLRRLR